MIYNLGFSFWETIPLSAALGALDLLSNIRMLGSWPVDTSIDPNVKLDTEKEQFLRI